MCRKYRRLICWVLVVVMGYSPIVVYAQQPASPGGTAAAAKAKIDLGYVTPKAVAAVVAYPKHVFTSPGMEMLPLEVITAAGKKFLGFDPVEIEQVMAVAEAPETMPPQGPPRAAIVLKMAKPLGQEKVLSELWARTTEGQLDGKTYRKAMGPMDVSIFQPDDRTLIVGTDDMIHAMWANRASPKEGLMSRALGHIESPSDLTAIVLVEPIRPLIAAPLAMAPLPPPLQDVKKVPDLLTSIGAKVNLTGNMAMSLTLKANDEAAAQQLEEIIDKLVDTARQAMAADLARQERSNDPVEQAGAQYAKRMSERMLQLIRPVRKGQTLTLATPTDGKNPQMVQMATIGILVGLLLPAVQAAREAARRAASTNNLRRIGLGILQYHEAKGQFPPAYNADKNGKPLLSWRVLILPYLEMNDLYQKFHLDEPWDSDHNKRLIAVLPMVYRNPSSAVLQLGKTNYLTIRGEKSVFPGGEGIKMSDVSDGASNTIMTVEAPDDSAVFWTKPDDFTYDANNPLKGLTGMRPGGFLAGFADGSVGFINSSIDPTVLKSLFTRNGGEQVMAP
jgi:hypothetical protein